MPPRRAAGQLSREEIAAYLPEQRVYLKYPGDDLWHERILAARGSSPQEWIVITPTLDVHEEDIRATGVLGYAAGARGGLPVPLRTLRVFRFNEAELVEYQDTLRADVADIAELITDQEPAPPLPPPPAPPPLLPHAPPARRVNQKTTEDAEVRPEGVKPVPPDPEAGAQDGEVWVALEARCGFSLGDPVDVVKSGVEFWRMGDRGVARSNGVEVMSVGLVGSLAADGGGVGDLRVLPFLTTPGPVARSFESAVLALSESPGTKWAVLGPRSVKWLCAAILEQGPGPRQRHYWWRSVLRLTASDNGVDDHCFLSDVIETAVCCDQLNVSELQCFEKIARRLQLWEEVYSVKLRKAEGGEEVDGWLDERAIFLGQGKSRGHALVCPLLEEWVAKQLEKESAVLKERRKAREERQLAGGLTASTTEGGASSGGGGYRGRGRGRG
jgi:hypothetical protein